MKILLSILILSLSNTALLVADEIQPTICRSEPVEKKFRTYAKDNIIVIAVCPKKGLYFVEILAKDKDTKEFKYQIKYSDLKVTKITDWETKTLTGSRILLVEFDY